MLVWSNIMLPRKPTRASSSGVHTVVETTGLQRFNVCQQGITVKYRDEHTLACRWLSQSIWQPHHWAE